MEPAATYPYRAEGWERQIYPMPAFAMLLVSDVEKSSRWYQDTLGFADVFTMRGRDGVPLLAHLRWCMYGDVLLTPNRSPIDGPRGLGVRLNFATASADDIAARARDAGADVVDGPANRPWNARDVTIADPDGYRLTFTAPQPHVLSDGPPSFDQLMAKVRDSIEGSDR